MWVLERIVGALGAPGGVKLVGSGDIQSAPRVSKDVLRAPCIPVSASK